MQAKGCATRPFSTKKVTCHEGNISTFRSLGGFRFVR